MAGVRSRRPTAADLASCQHEVRYWPIVWKKSAIALHPRNKFDIVTGKPLRILEIFVAHLGRGSGNAAIPDFFHTIGQLRSLRRRQVTALAELSQPMTVGVYPARRG